MYGDILERFDIDVLEDMFWLLARNFFFCLKFSSGSEVYTYDVYFTNVIINFFGDFSRAKN